MYFLYCVWAYNKNFQRIFSDDHNNDELSDESDDDSTNEDGEFVEKNTEGRYKTYTYDFLIKLILKHAPESATEKIRTIAKWRLKSNHTM